MGQIQRLTRLPPLLGHPTKSPRGPIGSRSSGTANDDPTPISWSNRSLHHSLALTIEWPTQALGLDNERLDVLDVMEERGLQDLVEVRGNKVRLIEPPENLRVRGKAGKPK